MVSISSCIMKKGGSALYNFMGLSSDVKPTKYDSLDIDNGSSFLELDTGAVYLFDAEHKIWIMLSGGGGGGSSAVFLGNIDNSTTSFPSSRPGGDALENGDYLKISPDAILPISLGGLEFTSYRDLAVYLGGEFVKSSTPAQTTRETPVSNSSEESIIGDSTTQAAINTEVKAAINNKQDKLTAGANITIVDNVISATGGGEGTTDYEELINLPKINNVELKGNKTLSDLGVAGKTYVDDELENKQETLVSGTNIKTINGASVLGEGDITVTGEPAAYLKTITKDTEEQTITITDKGGNEVSFGYGATTSGVTSVNGKTGEVTLVKADLELGNVDNTSDATKKANFKGEIAEDNDGFVIGGDIYSSLIGKEDISHKVTEISDESTNQQYPSARSVYTELQNKQDKLTPGANITIDENNVISATGGGTGAVESVNGHTGVVVLTKSDLGLGSVDNTSDVQKKTAFAGHIASEDYGFVVGDDVFDALAEKQENLESGTNIKTINGQSVLGSGDISIASGSGLTVIELSGMTGSFTEEETSLISGNPQNAVFKHNNIIYYFTSTSTWQAIIDNVVYQIDVNIDNTAWAKGTDKYIETPSNKVTSISSSSTDDQYPSAKCVYSMIGGVEAMLDNLTYGGGV